MLSLDVEVLGIDGRTLRAKIENAQKDLVHEMRTEIELTWHELAHKTLESTEEDYRKSLFAFIADVETVEVSLLDPQAVAVERGSKGFDLGPGFVGGRGRKKKRARRGGVRFRTINYQGQMRVIPIDAGFPEKPKSTEWKHPGIKPRKLHEKVYEEWRDRIMPMLSARFIGRISA